MDAADTESRLEPGIYLVATPIGNMDDITLRALRTLSQADVLACEDTRVTRKLFQRHGLSAPGMIVVVNDHTERKAAGRLTRLAQEGKVVVFCSDAGLPAISDPGWNIARAAREAGVLLDVIPGPSAVTTAVALAGPEGAGFTFLGFPPRRDSRLRRLLEQHADLPPAIVLYEAPRRLQRLLHVAGEVMGPGRWAAVCLELTKKFQRTVRGTLTELEEWFGHADLRGEATVVISGRQGARDDEDDDPDADGE